MSDTKALNKVLEIVKRESPYITAEHMADILAIANEAAAELAQLRTELDKCVAWHEGDCSPHAQLEQTIAQLRAQLT